MGKLAKVDPAEYGRLESLGWAIETLERGGRRGPVGDRSGIDGPGVKSSTNSPGQRRKHLTCLSESRYFRSVLVHVPWMAHNVDSVWLELGLGTA